MLLEPFRADESAARVLAQCAGAPGWKSDHSHVVFGNGEVPVRYGVHAELSTRAEALVRMVERTALGESVETDDCAHEHAPKGHARRLDPRQLLKSVKLIPLSSESSPQGTDPPAQIRSRDRGRAQSSQEESGVSSAQRMAGTTSSSPRWAKSTVSKRTPRATSPTSSKDHHIVEFLLDFLIAIVFSLAIAFFWRKYFDARLSDDAVLRELAKLWIIELSVLSVLVSSSF